MILKRFVKEMRAFCYINIYFMSDFDNRKNGFWQILFMFCRKSNQYKEERRGKRLGAYSCAN